jgi:pilus assembly protein Flp/PilA
MYVYLWLKNWFESEEGQDLVEYALLIALVSIAAIAAMLLLGPAVAAKFTSVTATLNAAS